MFSHWAISRLYGHDKIKFEMQDDRLTLVIERVLLAFSFYQKKNRFGQLWAIILIFCENLNTQIQHFTFGYM